MFDEPPELPPPDDEPARSIAPDDHIGGHGLETPITWLSAVRLGLGYAGEYALLSLIEDAPEALKVATVLCSIGALAALECRVWLEGKRKHLFQATIAAVSVIYLGFVGYAIIHVMGIQAKEAKLRELYVASGPIIDRTIPTAGDVNNVKYDSNAVRQFIDDGLKWEKQTEEWLLDNMGPAARERFVDISAIGFNCIGQLKGAYVCDGEYDRTKNRLIAEKKNLSSIMESSAYHD
jgi:hypothetical protein